MSDSGGGKAATNVLTWSGHTCVAIKPSNRFTIRARPTSSFPRPSSRELSFARRSSASPDITTFPQRPIAAIPFGPSGCYPRLYLADLQQTSALTLLTGLGHRFPVIPGARTSRQAGESRGSPRAQPGLGLSAGGQNPPIDQTLGRRGLHLTRLRHGPAALDLDGLDHLSDDAAERDAEPQMIGLAQDDAHVLLGPWHGKAVNLGLQRPVRRAALDQRFTQTIEVDAQPLGELEALEVRRDARPQDHVVDHLADLARAQLAEMEDGIGEACERRPARLESRGVATDHDQHLARLGRRLAAGERHVEEDDAGAGETRGKPLHGARRNRGGDADDEAFPRRGGDAVRGEQDGVRPLADANDDDDKVAAFRHRAWIPHDRDSGTLCLLAGALDDIAGGHVESGLAQMAGHRMPHLAEPDDTDAAHDALAHLSTLPVSTCSTSWPGSSRPSTS